MRTLIIPLVLSIAPASAGVEQKSHKGVDVTLISENKAIKAGETFTVGLKIHHHEGYHTYWKSPGIAGVPTEIQWELPEGFKAGEIQWPYPEKSMMAIHPVHGYERDVLLLVDIQAPENLSADQVDLKATATWMACAKGCSPGKAALQLVLPVAEAAAVNDEAAAEFAKSRAEIPKPLDGWTVETLSSPDAEEVHFRLKPTGALKELPGGLYFFSTDGQVSSDKPQTVTRAEDGTVEIKVARSKYSPSGKASIPGVLVADGSLTVDGEKFASVEAVTASALN